jgi:hypothetical protein
MENPSRRAFTQSMLGSLFTFSLVTTLCKGEMLIGLIKPLVNQWLIKMEQVTKALREGKVKPIEWQLQIESLLSRVELSDLLRAIDYQHLAKTAVLPDDHESAEDIDFSKIEGLPAELSFAPYFYAMKKGVAIVPHGHRNMTSMHMILDGQAHAWHYERIADEPQHLVIKPTKDKVFVRGDTSTISDQKDNIHWFKALTEPVFMFNIGVFGINPGASFTGRDYIDPVRGEKMQDGLIRVRRLNV